MSAELITIGTELLLGEIVDSNAAYLASRLRDAGLDLYRTTTVGDNTGRIAAAVREALGRAEVVITTGGLGPTVDDVTREAIAEALGVSTEFRPELWRQIKERFARYGREPTENNRRQAHLPEGAVAIENPVGTAPGFRLESENSAVIALPGVPAEMKHLFETEVLPYLSSRLKLGAVIISRLVRTAGVGESWLDERIKDLEEQSNPTVGIAAHPGYVDVRLTAKARDESGAVAMLDTLEAEVLRRLDKAVYGVGEVTLEEAALEKLRRRGWSLASFESGTGGALAARLATAGDGYQGGWTLPKMEPFDTLEAGMAAAAQALDSTARLGLRLVDARDRQQIEIRLQWPGGEAQVERSYGGATVNAPGWAASMALDFMRRRLSSDGG